MHLNFYIMTSEITQKNNFYVRYLGHFGPFSSPEDEGFETVNILLKMMAEGLQRFGTERMFFVDGFGSSIGMGAQDIVLDPETREIVVMPSKAPKDKDLQKLLELKR